MRFSNVNYVFGPPGSGKTTYLAKLNRYFLKHGRITYANFDLAGAIRIQESEIGYYNFNHGVIILDEAGIFLSNRDFANKNGHMADKNRLRYWKLVRHYQDAIIIMASQGWDDVDKKARDLASTYIMVSKWFFGISFAKQIFKSCDIDPMTHEPTDYYEFDGFLHWSPILRRRYYKDFDSFVCPELPDYPIPKDVPPESPAATTNNGVD